MPYDANAFDLPPLATPEDVAAALAEAKRYTDEKPGQPGPAGPRGPEGPQGPVGPSTGTADLSVFGMVALDSFAGSDDDKMTAALNYIAAQSHKPTLVLSNRRYTFNKRHDAFRIRGFRMTGPLGSTRATEFRSTVAVKCPAGGLFAWNSSQKDFAISNIAFDLTDYFIEPAPTNNSRGALTDLELDACSWFGGKSVLAGTFLRLRLERFYINGVSDTALRLGGSDNSIAQNGVCFLSGQLPANVPYMDFGMSSSVVGNIYNTPQGGFCTRVNFSYGGLIFNNKLMSDGTFRSGATGTAQAGLQITGGEAVTFEDYYSFNVNTDRVSKGDIVVTGGNNHVFVRPQFVKSHGGWTAVNPAGPAIYTTVPIKVIDPVSVNGFPKVLRQQRAGLITCNDPTWQVVTD